MPNPENPKAGRKRVIPWWMFVGVGVNLGVSLGFVTGQMNVCAFGGWALGALAALLFGRRS
ncbi:MAG: hypothetical protein V4710_05970 [Verrucomicrobiota bacterium]